MARCFRIALPLLLLVASLSGAAQQPVVRESWEELRTLPVHTTLDVVTEQGKRRCRFIQATEEVITCETASYARPEVRSVRVIRHGRSTVKGLLVGLGVGAGVGVGVGAALGNSAFATPGRGAAVGVAIFAPAGAVIGALVGRGVDSSSKQVYKR